MTRAIFTVLLVALITGCTSRPSFVPAEKQMPIDRAIIETPAGFNITVFAAGLTAPSAICFDPEGVMFIAESGVENDAPRIIALKPDGSTFNVYPTGNRLSVPLFSTGFRLHGPIGGMVVHNERLYVTHRDGNGKGVITAFAYNGSHETIIADLPCQGDYSVTDIAVRPSDGRIIFGVGAATNSGVVGLDNWEIGWPRKYPGVCDQLAIDTKINGYRMDSKNPLAGLFGGGDETAVTGAFQPFGQGYLTRIPRAANGKPNAAIYSIDPGGGDLQIEAHGIRCPAGLGFFGKRPFATNQGMELRGTRPIKDDPDALLRVLNDAHYGWPDYSADLWPISEPRFQPPRQMIQKTGYTEISPLIDAISSGLTVVERDVALQGTFPSQSGASKFAFPSDSGPFKQFYGSAIIACFGDRSPFSTSNQKLLAPVGFKVMRVSLDEHAVSDFIVNTQRLPASKLDRSTVALERPIDVKFGPDGAMYILDFGVMRMKNGKMDVKDGTGRIFKVTPQEAPTTSPAGS